MQYIDKTPDLKSTVAKSNELVPIMGRYDLQELGLIAYCIGHYDSRKPDNRKFTAKVSDLASIFLRDEDSAYSVVKRVVTAMSKPFALKNENDEELFIWCSKQDKLFPPVFFR